MIAKALALATAVLLIALAVCGWLLKESYKENGALKNANEALSRTLKEKDNALAQRARIDRDVRALPDAELERRLR